MMRAIEESMMPAPAVCAFWGLALTLLLPIVVLADDRTAVQQVPCEPGRDLLLARDGTVSACRLAAAVELLVGAAAGNPKVACAAGARAEFHRSGYLSFCDPAAAAASYLTRGRRSSQCRAQARVAFDENGFLEYCS
jgi:hypothetical protein